MIAIHRRGLAASVGALFLMGLSSCVYDPVPPPQVGALGPPPSGVAPYSEYADDGMTDVDPPEPGTGNRDAPDLEGDYPTGYKTDKAHQVISPFKPHNLIDISENPKTGRPFGSGDLVKDPSNQQIFRIP